mmetsp:Transcript_30364/g.90539  ORF Transcript_30364/g.90539 Transcript_30364/m.90539 type:complete len:528 (-) Transcript_30364:145-1728(-)
MTLPEIEQYSGISGFHGPANSYSDIHSGSDHFVIFPPVLFVVLRPSHCDDRQHGTHPSPLHNCRDLVQVVLRLDRVFHIGDRDVEQAHDASVSLSGIVGARNEYGVRRPHSPGRIELASRHGVDVPLLVANLVPGPIRGHRFANNLARGGVARGDFDAPPVQMSNHVHNVHLPTIVHIRQGDAERKRRCPVQHLNRAELVDAGAVPISVFVVERVPLVAQFRNVVFDVPRRRFVAAGVAARREVEGTVLPRRRGVRQSVAQVVRADGARRLDAVELRGAGIVPVEAEFALLAADESAVIRLGPAGGVGLVQKLDVAPVPVLAAGRDRLQDRPVGRGHVRGRAGTLQAVTSVPFGHSAGVDHVDVGDELVLPLDGGEGVGVMELLGRAAGFRPRAEADAAIGPAGFHGVPPGLLVLVGLVLREDHVVVQVRVAERGGDDVAVVVLLYHIRLELINGNGSRGYGELVIRVGHLSGAEGEGCGEASDCLEVGRMRRRSFGRGCCRWHGTGDGEERNRNGSGLIDSKHDEC